MMKRKRSKLAWEKTGEFEYTLKYNSNNGRELTIKVVQRLDIGSGEPFGWGYDVYRVNGTIADCEQMDKQYETPELMQRVIEDNFDGFLKLV